MFIKPTSENKILQIIDSFRNKSSEDIDEISIKLIKQVKNCVVAPLNYICNLSLKSGVFPDKMKIAKVLPLYKSNGHYNLSYGTFATNNLQ